MATVALLLAPIFLVAQLLNVPVTDNSASSSNSWLENQQAPGLDQEKMHWYRHWTASPILTPESVFKGRTIARAYIKVAQVDILRRSGVEYARILNKNGVIVYLKEYTSVPHAVLSMAGKLLKRSEILADVIRDLSEASI